MAMSCSTVGTGFVCVAWMTLGPRGSSKYRVMHRRRLLRRCFESGFFLLLFRCFDLGRLLFDQLDEMVDDVGVFEAVVGEAADIDLMGAVAAAGEADIGLARLARAVDDAADHRERERCRDVREPFLEALDGLDDLELLARAGRT